MSTLDPQSRFSKDDRYELASRAENQQRQNHPTHLVFFGVVLLIVSIIVLFVTWRTDAKAQESLQNKAQQFESIKAELATLAMLERQSENTQRNAEFDKITDMRSRQDSIATSVGLESSIGLPKTTSSQQNNATRTNYTYTVRDKALEKILAWIQASTEQIPGLAVSNIDIKPSNLTWTVQVTLFRYERIE
jgi:hypothetical protein